MKAGQESTRGPGNVLGPFLSILGGCAVADELDGPEDEGQGLAEVVVYCWRCGEPCSGGTWQVLTADYLSRDEVVTVCDTEDGKSTCKGDE